MRALLALVLVALSALPASANDHAWLVGKWELTHAPDGDAKDWVEFTPEGPDDARTSSQRTTVEGR